MLASPLPSPTAAAPVGLGLGLAAMAGIGAEMEGGFGALLQRATAGWAMPLEAAAGAAVMAPEGWCGGMPVPVAAAPMPATTEASGDTELGGLLQELLPLLGATATMPPAEAPSAGEVEVPDAAIESALPDQPQPELTASPPLQLISLPEPTAKVAPEPAPTELPHRATPAFQGEMPRTAPDMAAPALPPSGTPAVGPGAFPLPLQGPSAPPPTDPAPPLAAPQPPPGLEMPRPVILALPPGVVPQLMSPQRPTNVATAQPATPGDEPQRNRPAAQRSALAPAGTYATPASAEPQLISSAWLEPAALAPIAPVAPPAGRPQPVIAIPPVEQAIAAAAKPQEPVPAAVPAVAVSEPAHVAPPSPTRQLLPITIAMLISPGTAPTLTVTLDPGEIGQVEIRVGRDAEGTTLRLIAERPETTALMQRDGRELQQGLAQSGIRLDAGAIQFETAGGGARQEAGQPRDRQPPRDTWRGPAPPIGGEPEAPLSLLDMHI